MDNEGTCCLKYEEVKLGVPRDCIEEMDCFSRLTLKRPRMKQKLKNEFGRNQLWDVVKRRVRWTRRFFLQLLPVGAGRNEKWRGSSGETMMQSNNWNVRQQLDAELQLLLAPRYIQLMRHAYVIQLPHHHLPLQPPLLSSQQLGDD